MINAKAFLADMAALKDELLQLDVPTAVNAAVDATMKSAQNTTLHEDVSQALRSHVTEWTSHDHGEVTFGAQNRSGDYYAVYVNNGTAPHKIAPKNVSSLKFWWARENRPFIGRDGQAVNPHPGTKPRPFIDEAAAAGEKELHRSLDQEVGNAISRTNAKK